MIAIFNFRIEKMSAYSFGVTPITCHAWNGKGDGKID